MKCWWCRIFGHRWYKGLASWACTRACCYNKADAVKAAPAEPIKALAWWDGSTSTDAWSMRAKSLDCLDGKHNACDADGGCEGCTCHWLED